MIQVELQSVAGCPHVDAARALLRECLLELQLDVAVADKVGAYPSPTILVNGADAWERPLLKLRRVVSMSQPGSACWRR